jgi:hypothetical protein
MKINNLAILLLAFIPINVFGLLPLSDEKADKKTITQIISTTTKHSVISLEPSVSRTIGCADVRRRIVRVIRRYLFQITLNDPTLPDKSRAPQIDENLNEANRSPVLHDHV